MTVVIHITLIISLILLVIVFIGIVKYIDNDVYTICFICGILSLCVAYLLIGYEIGREQEHIDVFSDKPKHEMKISYTYKDSILVPSNTTYIVIKK